MKVIIMDLSEPTSISKYLSDWSHERVLFLFVCLLIFPMNIQREEWCQVHLSVTWRAFVGVSQILYIILHRLMSDMLFINVF